MDITNLSAQLGMPLWAFVIILIWSLTWKLLALWKSARKGSIFWFIILGVVNTVGILEMLYIFVFSKMNFENKIEKVKAVKKNSKKKK